jgi:hypothetical protein
MLRIAVFLVLLLIILVAVYFPRFRRTLGVTIFILFGAIGVIIWQDTQDRELEFERISLEQAQLLQMKVRPGLNARSFVVAGRLQNLAKDYTILSIELQATVKDCHLGDCDIVGQGQVTLPVEVPAAQSRDFSVTIPFSVFPEIKGEAGWEYGIMKIRAR